MRTYVADIAENYQIEPALIVAIADVEAGRKAFRYGKPVLLFERHVFERSLRRHGIDPSELVRNDVRLTEIVSYKPYTTRRGAPNSERYGSYKQQWSRFEWASRINPEAAIEACSFGRFQVLGENWALCGFESQQDFFDANHSEEGQFQAFVGYLSAVEGLIPALRDHDWLQVKKLYNGPRIKDKNRNGVDDYAEALAAAYAKAIKQHAPRKPLHRSRTVQANAADASVKVAGGSALVVGSQVVFDNLERFTTFVNEIQGHAAEVKALQDSLASLGWLPWVMGAVFVLALIPNLRILYTYLDDNGYLGDD